MKLLSINVSWPRPVEMNGEPVMTGIYKEPVAGPTRLHRLGLEGDGQADLSVHGGEHQAVYGYAHEHYATWERELERPALSPGTFGENLTCAGLLETEVRIGDRYRVGTVELQPTGPRLPCFKFAHKMGRNDIIKRFLLSGRSGIYFRVLREGEVTPGDEIELLERAPHGLTVRRLLGLMRLGEGGREEVERALQVETLADFAREDLKRRLARLS